MAANLGAIAGYTLSGVMITYFGWRSIFLLNVPIGIFGTVWGYLRLKETGIKPVGQKFDYAGSVLYCIGAVYVSLLRYGWCFAGTGVGENSAGGCSLRTG